MAVPSGGAARAKGVITPLSSKLPWPPHTHSVGKTVVKMLTYMRHLYTNTRTHKLLHIPSSKTNDISVVGRLATRHSFISNRLSELIWALSQINFAAVFFPDLSVSSDISLIWWACSKSIGWPYPPCPVWHFLADIKELAQSQPLATPPPSPVVEFVWPVGFCGYPKGIGFF